MTDYKLSPKENTILLKQRKIHKDAYKYISEALQLEESFISNPKDKTKENKLRALRLYECGVKQLRSGIKTLLQGEGVEWDRVRDLQQKMQDNLSLSEERIRILASSSSSATSSSSSGATMPRRNIARGAPRGATQPFMSDNPPAPAPAAPTSTTRIRPARGSSKKNKNPPRTAPNPPNTETSAPFSPKRVPNTLNKENVSQDAATKVKSLKGVDNKLALLILDEIVEHDTKICFHDISHGSAKQALLETVILPSLRPELFTGLRSPSRGILLFGPPGNGKTMLAKAVSQESKATFFNISASSLTSKYLGESEKLIRALFALARHLQPSIIFFDEVDSLLCKRNESEHEASRRIKTEFMLQFDGVSNTDEDCRVLVMGCTNRPFELDTAVLRRFPKRIYISNPDQASRRLLIVNMLRAQKHSVSDAGFDDIARMTDGYSCSDLTALVRDAALAPIRELRPDQIKVISESKMRGITRQDLLTSLSSIRGSITNEDMKVFESWNKDYGDIKT